MRTPNDLSASLRGSVPRIPAMPSPTQKARFRHALAAARRGAGLSQRQLAGRVGIGDTAISQYERGVITPEPERCEALEDALDLERGELGQHLGYYPYTGAAVAPEAAIEADPTIHHRVKAAMLAMLAEERQQAQRDNITDR